MKKLFLLLTLLILATICNAQIKLEANKEGIYRAKSDSLEWVDAEITAHPEALRYDLKFSKAIQSPGEKILGERSEEILKLKPIFKKLVEVKEYFIVYNSQTKNIDYIEATPIRREETSYLILFSITSILLMIISNILYKKGQDGFFAAFAATAVIIIAAFAFIVVVAFAATAFIVVAAFTATVVAALAFFASTSTDKGYKVFSIIFYILMVGHIVLLFI